MINVYILKSSERKDSKSLLCKVYKELFNKDFDINKIYYNEYGKPYYDKDFYFNISYSKNYIALAISNVEIGIDIEEERRKNDRINNKILSNNEIIINNNILNNWVIKEAYTKYLGMGLKKDFTTFNANDLLKDSFLKDISTKEYYCYVYGKGNINVVNKINIEYNNC